VRRIDQLERHIPTTVATLRKLARGRFELFPPRFTFALNELHIRIKTLFGQTPGTYFEVGANDGVSQSNTAYLEKYCGWTGILVEPVPHKFVQCKLNRPGSAVFHAALVPMDYPDKYVELHYSDLMTISTLSERRAQCESLLSGRNHLRADGALHGQIFVAPAMTVMDVWHLARKPQIDFFSLDVEGAELPVLSGIDFNTFRPKYFLIETTNLPAVVDLLSGHGYQYTSQWSHHDHLFSLSENTRPCSYCK